jgi:hypothetical protein
MRAGVGGWAGVGRNTRGREGSGVGEGEDEYLSTAQVQSRIQGIRQHASV